ncbi:hypothetical protein WJX79_006639 [Trebouxia sp. C0005]
MERNLSSHSRPEECSREQSQTPSEPDQTSVARQQSPEDPTASYNARIEAALERRLANGRESQRRFRERQKARSQSTEVQLARATTELTGLRTRQAELESRNVFLENLATLNAPAQVQAALNTQAARQASDTGDAICTISLQDPPYHMSHADVNKLTLSAFATLWTEYVRQIGSCLLQLGISASTAPTLQLVTSMQRLTVEAAGLCAVLLQDPVANKALITARLDEGAAATNALDTEFYTSLLELISLTLCSRSQSKNGQPTIQYCEERIVECFPHFN